MPNKFKIALHNDYNTIDRRKTKFSQISGSLLDIRNFLNDETININFEVVYASCLNFIKDNLDKELDRKSKLMLKNMNGCIKFDYYGEIGDTFYELIKKKYNLE
jgi:predicted membrane GTPase involved in stress response